MFRPTFFVALWIVAGGASAGTVVADALWRKGEYRGAFAQAFEAAQRGDSHAQFLLGEAYRLGRSVYPSITLAQDWYARAARQGDIAASTELGLIEASQHQPDQALPWLTFAAAHGDARALCSLAALYFNGDGVAQDPVRAYALMARAVAAGLPEAKERLGLLHEMLAAETQAQGEALAAGPWLRAPSAMAVAPVRRSAPTAPPGRGFRVQVGSYRSLMAADRAWAMLATQVGGIGRNPHSVIQAGPVYRVQLHLPDAATARAVSRQLDSAHWAQLMLRRPSGTR